MIIYIYIYQYTHIFYIIKLYTCICTCMYTCIYNHINMCVYVYIHVYMRFMIPQRERSRYPTAPGQLGDRSRGYGQGLEKAGDGNGALGPDCCGISSFETRLSPAGRKPPEGRLPQLRVWGHQDVYNYRSWAGGLVWHYILLVSWLIHRPDGSLDFRRKTIKQSIYRNSFENRWFLCVGPWFFGLQGLQFLSLHARGSHGMPRPRWT